MLRRKEHGLSSLEFPHLSEGSPSGSQSWLLSKSVPQLRGSQDHFRTTTLWCKMTNEIRLPFAKLRGWPCLLMLTQTERKCQSSEGQGLFRNPSRAKLSYLLRYGRFHGTKTSPYRSNVFPHQESFLNPTSATVLDKKK